MKKSFKPETEERPPMIIAGIVLLYLLISLFFVYLLILHRISMISAVVSIIIFTAIYFKRFLIIYQLKTKDDVKIVDEYLMVNGTGIYTGEILDFKIEMKKPVIIFFMNNKMVIFQEAVFHLKTKGEQVSFNVIGTEKIKLLKEFLDLNNKLLS